MNDILQTLLSLTNEALASGIVIIAVSLLLYNLTRNLHDRVARTSGVVLGCVTITYIGDAFIALDPGAEAYAAALRLQWIGIGFLPVAMFHLSDALLATTGLPSRGRRRRMIRVLYAISAVFFAAAALSEALIVPVVLPTTGFDGATLVSLNAGWMFPAYLIYFAIVTGYAIYNVQRARDRCLTRATRRRMSYLQIALLTPALGVFPFSVVLGAGEEFTIIGLLLVNVANIFVILMLIFLAYPLSFFGSRIPDRVVKAQLLRFLLHGPGTGLLALGTILFVNPTARFFGISGQEFLPFAVVLVVLVWQWSISLTLPWLERRLVYSGEDADQMEKLSSLSQRLLTRGDMQQLAEAILASVCDYLRVNSAFIATLNGVVEIVASQGALRPSEDTLRADQTMLMALRAENDNTLALHRWNLYWVMPLLLNPRGADTPRQVGILGIQARAEVIDLTDDDRQMLATFSRRASQLLDDMALQGEIFAALEGLLPQINITRQSAADIEYRASYPLKSDARAPMPQVIDYEGFKDQVRAALKHYWGGPGLTSSRLLEMQIVRVGMSDHDHNPTKALRAVLQEAIERQKPDGERKMNDPEWTVYNILDLRYVKQAKVREVASRLFLSEPDFYRKQRAAIDALARVLVEMEQTQLTLDDTPPSLTIAPPETETAQLQ